MESIKKQLTFFGSALNIRNRRNDIIASNIANSATPNYKARDINFLDEFKKVTNTGDIKITHSNHIPTKNYNISIYRTKPLDDNNFIEGTIGVGQIKSDLVRKNGSNTLTGSRDGNQIFGSINYGKTFSKKETVKFLINY